MTDHGGEFSFRLRARRDPARGRWWLVVPLKIGASVELALVPNTVAGRSVITPPALNLLRTKGLVGADIVDLQTGRQDCLLQNVRLAGHQIPEFTVQVRDVEELRSVGNQYLVDGYLGLNVLLGLFSLITIDTQQLRITLRLRA